MKYRWAIGDDRIGYLDFSFHDTYERFREIVNSCNWTLCQIQYNFDLQGYI